MLHYLLLRRSSLRLFRSLCLFILDRRRFSVLIMFQTAVSMDSTKEWPQFRTKSDWRGSESVVEYSVGKEKECSLLQVCLRWNSIDKVEHLCHQRHARDSVDRRKANMVLQWH